jgi:multiple sugar transport system permease protein
VRRYRIRQGFWTVATIMAMTYALVPVLWIVSLSLKDPGDLSDKRFFPRSISFENYAAILDDGHFIAALRNSIGISFLSTVLAVMLAAFAAYAIARLNFPGKVLVLAGALAIAMFPSISIIGPLFNMWRSLRLYDTWPGLIIPYLTFALPIAIWTLWAFFREIPWDLEKAARVDGATPFQAFWLVIAPLAAPGVITAIILVFILTWHDVLFAISLTSTDAARTVPAALAFFPGASEYEQPIGSIAAAAVVVTIPVIIIVLLFQRRIVTGLTSGAVKN